MTLVLDVAGSRKDTCAMKATCQRPNSASRISLGPIKLTLERYKEQQVTLIASRTQAPANSRDSISATEMRRRFGTVRTTTPRRSATMSLLYPHAKEKPLIVPAPYGQ